MNGKIDRVLDFIMMLLGDDRFSAAVAGVALVFLLGLFAFGLQCANGVQ